MRGRGTFSAFPSFSCVLLSPRDVPWVPARFKDADGDCWRICYPILQLLWGQFGISHTSTQSKVSQRLKLQDDAEVTKRFPVSLSSTAGSYEAMQGFTPPRCEAARCCVAEGGGV